MRASGIVSHSVLGTRRLSTDPRPLTYDPADVVFTGSDGRRVDLSKEPPVLKTADGEKVYPATRIPWGMGWRSQAFDHSTNIFLREYMGDFPKPSPEYRRAYDAWRSYYEQTDAHDRRVCGPSGTPFEGWQRAMIAQNAAAEHARVRRLLDGIDPETVRQARDAALRDAERGR